MTQGEKWWATMIEKHGSKEAVLEQLRKGGAKGGKYLGRKGFAISGVGKEAGRKGGMTSKRGFKYLGGNDYLDKATKKVVQFNNARTLENHKTSTKI